MDVHKKTVIPENDRNICIKRIKGMSYQNKKMLLIKAIHKNCIFIKIFVWVFFFWVATQFFFGKVG